MVLEVIREFGVYILIFLALIGLYISFNYLVEKKAKEKIPARRKILIRKTLNIIFIFALFLTILSIWGIETRNVFFFLGSIFALIAVGFFAVWSILSNILSGIIFFTGAIRIDDEIMIIPEKIRGKVVDINSMFVTLKNAKGETFNIPNNMVFQRVVKKFPRK